MKTIFMLVNYMPTDYATGITKKISAQINALRHLGYSVFYTAYDKDRVNIHNNDDEVVFSQSYLFSCNTKLRNVFRYPSLLQCAIKYIENTNNHFDFCYGRISATNRTYLKLLSLLKEQGAQIIIEALAYFPGVKMKTLKGKYIYRCIEKKQKHLKVLVDKFITEGNVSDFFGIRCEQGRIGIDVAKLPRHNYIGDPNEINMISVATELEYHGYDRLLRSVAAYRASGGKHRIVVHLVGNLLDRTLKLIDELELQDTVITYGRVYGDGLFSIYQKCNMGIGPIAQHRVGGKKDTGLKTKEYFGIGLPYFYAGEEADLPDDYPYVYEVPSDESMLDFDALWQFYTTYKDNLNTSTEMREFAIEVFSWIPIMKKAMLI